MSGIFGGSLRGLGAPADPADPAASPSPLPPDVSVPVVLPTTVVVGDPGVSTGDDLLWSALRVVGVGAGAYHGYRRDRSVGWALWWAICGGLAPIITVPVAIAQGFGKPKR